ncbi:Protein of unknown function [Pyronema omphalodes CBS 100304]|uniref:Uncharacterized protein n=1 Tax=Pyronema omphalodes (strain CBS 100304) TaxID=1076935 RepID=U4L266_PYROM|nr:Protein of unknown function [Pyronema omphalodes CBS 100304]
MNLGNNPQVAPTAPQRTGRVCCFSHLVFLPVTLSSLHSDQHTVLLALNHLTSSLRDSFRLLLQLPPPTLSPRRKDTRIIPLGIHLHNQNNRTLGSWFLVRGFNRLSRRIMNEVCFTGSSSSLSLVSLVSFLSSHKPLF